jgi:hypothetical protein
MTLNDKNTEQLRIQLANCKRVLSREPQNEKAAKLVREISVALANRRGSRGKDYLDLEWNPETIRRTMKRFEALTKTVPNNGRTAFTEAGGAKKRGEAWIDAYTAVKTNGVNLSFGALVRKQGEEPVFRIRNSTPNGSINTTSALGENCDLQFSPAELDQAYDVWKGIILEAGGSA